MIKTALTFTAGVILTALAFMYQPAKQDYELQASFDYQSDVYVIDYGLSRDDCDLAQLHYEETTGSAVTFTCVPEQ